MVEILNELLQRGRDFFVGPVVSDTVAVAVGFENAQFSLGAAIIVFPIAGVGCHLCLYDRAQTRGLFDRKLLFYRGQSAHSFAEAVG